jgi:hypothetical protein
MAFYGNFSVASKVISIVNLLTLHVWKMPYKIMAAFSHPILMMIPDYLPLYSVTALTVLAVLLLKLFKAGGL